MNRNEIIETAYELIRDSAESCNNTGNDKGYVDFVDGITSMTEALLEKLKYSMKTDLS